MDKMYNIPEEHKKMLNYYKQKYSNHFSPALLDYHVTKWYNKAVETYDPTKSQFQTHLAMYMNKLSRDAANKGGTIKTSENNRLNSNKIIKTKEEFVVAHGREPTVDELSKILKIDKKAIQEAIDNSNLHTAIVHGIDTSKLDISLHDLIGNVSNEDKKIIDTIEKGMSSSEALRYTGLKNTSYYSKRKKLENALKQAYLKYTMRYSND